MQPEQSTPESVADQAISPLTRRTLLVRGGSTVVAMSSVSMLLAACGDDDDAATTAEIGGVIDFLGWEGYDLPQQLKAFQIEHDINLKASYIGNQNDVQAKLVGGGGNTGFDIINYYQAFQPLYTELGILEPIDPEQVPNFEGLFSYFRDDADSFWHNDDGTLRGVPFTWGANALTYDSSAVSEPKSYDEIFDPKYAGKVAVADETITAVALAAQILGLNPQQMTESDFDQVKSFLADVIAQSRGVSASYGDVTTLLVNGEAVFAFPGWASINGFAADAGKDTIRMAVPSEGGVSFADTYAVAPGSDNVETAVAWINESIDPKINAKAQNYLIGGTPVEDSVSGLDPAVRDFYPYDDIDGFFEQVPFSTSPPEQSDEYVTMSEVIDAWQELKANAGA